MRKLDIDKFVADLMSLNGTDTRWRHQGRDPAISLDCIGFPRWGFIQQFDLPAALEAEFAAYHRRPDGKRFLQTISTWFDEVPRETMQKGDLVVIYDRRNPQHTAVATDHKHVVEAYASGRLMKIVYWPLGTWREIAGVFRFPVEGEKAELWQQ
jgi:hypothetical protein